MNEAKVDKKESNALKKLLVNLAYLLLGCEVQRNPAALIIHYMVLELIHASQLTWQDALAKAEYQQSCAGGEMPMSMGKYKPPEAGEKDPVKSEPVKCARVLQSHYGFFAINRWTYAGDRAIENAGNRELTHIQKLVAREKAIVEKWLVFKKLDKAKIEDQIQALTGILNEKDEKAAPVAVP